MQGPTRRKAFQGGGRQPFASLRTAGAAIHSVNFGSQFCHVVYWDNTDIDRTVEAGVSIIGKNWGRPNDTIGLAGVINGLAPIHAAYFEAGGMGIVIGDGQLNYGLEQIVEAYYNYAVTDSTKVTFDYQFIANPGYNADRGPVNVFAGRFHWQF
jgi:high affinity Mn2+ porin